MTFYSVTVARTIWLPDYGLRTETCRSVLMCKFDKFYICAVAGKIIDLTRILLRAKSNFTKFNLHHEHVRLPLFSVGDCT